LLFYKILNIIHLLTLIISCHKFFWWFNVFHSSITLLLNFLIKWLIYPSILQISSSFIYKTLFLKVLTWKVSCIWGLMTSLLTFPLVSPQILFSNYSWNLILSLSVWIDKTIFPMLFLQFHVRQIMATVDCILKKFYFHFSL
jgi:hypothetical protein